MTEDTKTILQAIANLDASVQKIDVRLISVENKIDGIHRRIDSEVEERVKLKMRLEAVETKLFGAPQAA